MAISYWFGLAASVLSISLHAFVIGVQVARGKDVAWSAMWWAVGVLCVVVCVCRLVEEADSHQPTSSPDAAGS